jgi:hypothetical protein
VKRRTFNQPRREATQSTYTPRPRTPAKPVLIADGKARMVVQVPKANPMRSEAYRRLVATLPCALCGVQGFSQVAHANQGKGMGIKVSDAESMPLCGPRPFVLGCHAGVDSGGLLNKTERRECELLWANQTRMKLREMAAGDADVRRVVERTIGT